MHTVFLFLEELVELHRMLINRFGGEPGTRDIGLVESALARPKSGYYKSLSEQAAALLQSLARNHGFVDGNKRVAFAACAVFLRMNGYRLVANADDAEEFLVRRVIDGHAELDEMRGWIEGAMKRA